MKTSLQYSKSQQLNFNPVYYYARMHLFVRQMSYYAFPESVCVESKVVQRNGS
jgi:hypothetical protein